MSVVDATSTSPAAAFERGRALQEWAMSSSTPHEHAIAVDLVLTHDFDEPLTASRSTDAVAAQAARERYLLEITGIASNRHTAARLPDPEASVRCSPARARTAPDARRPARTRSATAVR